MRYTGKLFHPEGTELELDLAGLSPIQGKLAFDVFGQIKSRMEHDQFGIAVDASPMYPPTNFNFKRYGQTAAVVRFSPASGEDHGKLLAALAILPRLDRADDTAALAALLGDGEVSGVIAEEDFEAAHRHAGALTAAFFLSEEALNAPLLHGLMSLAGAAFFDRLGLLA